MPTKKQIKEILKSKFADPADAIYWQNQLKEAERLERNAKENERFYRSYERGVKAFKDHKRKKR